MLRFGVQKLALSGGKCYWHAAIFWSILKFERRVSTVFVKEHRSDVTSKWTVWTGKKALRLEH